jgi:pimeloyl-ACP methyl ester carboxylesterase
MSRSGALEKPTVAEKTRIVTPARIVALALITLLVAGLAYLRFVPGSGSVSVPEGAKPGDLILQPCDYATENGSYAADCGTLVVPENRADEQSRLIALPVTRIPARSNHSREPIFILQGGPGHSNMTFDKVSRYADERDVVLVGYRGVDGSARLDCPEVESALSHSTDLASEKTSQAYADAYRACADRLTADGLDLGSYGIAQQVDDMEAARTALGYDRIDLLSESAGTRTAIIYSWRYPDSIHRSVMVGVNPPGHFLFYPGTTDEQIDRYAALCAKDDSCRARTADLSASIRQANAEIPDRWLFLPIKKGNVRIASFFGLMESEAAGAPYAGPTIVTCGFLQPRATRAASGLARSSPTSCFPNCSSGASTPPSAGPMPRRRGTTSPPVGRTTVPTSDVPQPHISGVAAYWQTPGRQHRMRTSTARCEPLTWRPCWSAGSSTSQPRRRS